MKKNTKKEEYIFSLDHEYNIKDLEKYNGKSVVVKIFQPSWVINKHPFSIKGIIEFINGSSFRLYTNEYQPYFGFKRKEYQRNFKHRTRISFIVNKHFKDRKVCVFLSDKKYKLAEYSDCKMVNYLDRSGNDICMDGLIYIIKNFVPKKFQNLTPVQAYELVKRRSGKKVPGYVEEFLFDKMLK